MERRGTVICSVLAFLGLLSAGMGFAAEATRVKASQIQYASSMCMYPRSPAKAFGLTAAVALIVAQAIVFSTSQCICSKRSSYSNSHWTLALVCYIVSWFTFIIAILLLLTATALDEDSVYFGTYYCYVPKPGVFAGGSVLSLCSVTLGTLYYLIVSSAKENGNPWSSDVAPPQSSVAMGQPQFPPQASREPVFVHEDTYVRRQFA